MSLFCCRCDKGYMLDNNAAKQQTVWYQAAISVPHSLKSGSRLVRVSCASENVFRICRVTLYFHCFSSPCQKCLPDALFRLQNCTDCFSCPFLSCLMQHSSCKDTKQVDWGESETLQRKRGDRREENVEERERQDTIWEGGGGVEAFLFYLIFWKYISFQAGARMWVSEWASWALLSQQHVGACHRRRRRDSYKFTTAAD